MLRAFWSRGGGHFRTKLENAIRHEQRGPTGWEFAASQQGVILGLWAGRRPETRRGHRILRPPGLDGEVWGRDLRGPAAGIGAVGGRSEGSQGQVAARGRAGAGREKAVRLSLQRVKERPLRRFALRAGVRARGGLRGRLCRYWRGLSSFERRLGVSIKTLPLPVEARLSTGKSLPETQIVFLPYIDF